MALEIVPGGEPVSAAPQQLKPSRREARGTMSRESPSRRRWLGGAARVAAVLAIFLGVRALTQRGVASGAAPALSGPDLAGHTVSLTDYDGRAVMVHFWATWCEVCNAESGTVDALARDHAVLTVATDSGRADEIKAAMEKRGLSFPVIVDADGRLARAWGVTAFPTSFFVGRDHRIRLAETGFTSGPGFRARLWLVGR